MDERREVMIALMPQPRDLVFAQERGWYRVRSQEMAERLRGGLQQFTHLASYQPDSFGTDRRCIRYFAPIRELARTRRIELLPEEPAHPRAQQLYLRFDLGPLEELPQPIVSARGRRILFIATTWSKMKAARDINDLFVGSPIEDDLYARLRSEGMLPEREYHIAVTTTAPRRRTIHYFLDIALLCRHRSLDIECDGDTWHAQRETIRTDNERDNLLQANLWHVLRFNTVQIRDDPGGTINVIREAANRYGGVVDPDHVVRHFDQDGRLGPGQGELDLGFD